MKNIFTIGTIVLVGGTLAAYLFGKIDFTTFGTVVTGISGIMFGLYQKWSKEEVVKVNMQLEDQLSSVQSNFKGLMIQISQRDDLINHLTDKVNSEIVSNETPIEVTKPKRTRKK